MPCRFDWRHSDLRGNIPYFVDVSSETMPDVNVLVAIRSSRRHSSDNAVFFGHVLTPPTLSLDQGFYRMSADSPHARFTALGLTLPPVPKPAGLYKPCLIVGSQLSTSGHLPMLTDGTLMRGCIGRDHDADGGKAAARQAGLTILATLIGSLDSLDKISRVIKVLGLINCTSDFEKHPHVINGCSELFAEIWGPDRGVGVRSAVGVGSLPSGVPVEIEAIFELA